METDSDYESDTDFQFQVSGKARVISSGEISLLSGKTPVCVVYFYFYSAANIRVCTDCFYPIKDTVPVIIISERRHVTRLKEDVEADVFCINCSLPLYLIFPTDMCLMAEEEDSGGMCDYRVQMAARKMKTWTTPEILSLTAESFVCCIYFYFHDGYNIHLCTDCLFGIGNASMDMIISKRHVTCRRSEVLACILHCSRCQNKLYRTLPRNSCHVCCT